MWTQCQQPAVIRRGHSSATCPFIFRSSTKYQWSLYRVHIGKMRTLHDDADDGGSLCVMYAGVNGPPVTEHSSVGRSTSRSDRRARRVIVDARRQMRWRRQVGRLTGQLALHRPARTATVGGQADVPEHSSAPTRRPPTRLMKQPSSHFQQLPVSSTTTTPYRNTCH